MHTFLCVVPIWCQKCPIYSFETVITYKILVPYQSSMSLHTCLTISAYIKRAGLRGWFRGTDTFFPKDAPMLHHSHMIFPCNKRRGTLSVCSFLVWILALTQYLDLVAVLIHGVQSSLFYPNFFYMSLCVSGVLESQPSGGCLCPCLVSTVWFPWQPIKIFK